MTGKLKLKKYSCINGLEVINMGDKLGLETSRLSMERSTFSSRQESFDFLKFFLAFLVVVIHTGFAGYAGLGIKAFARIAVPMFFMITGYYLPVMSDEKFRKYLIKITCLTVFSTLFYTLIPYVQSQTGSHVSTDWFAQTFSMKRILKWFLLNEFMLAGHLWYFYALLYVLVIIYITRKIKKMNMLYMLIPFLFLGDYLLSFFGRIVYYRNFLFLGLPYVLLGCLFRNYENRILDMFHKSRTLILWFVILCISLCVEMLVYKLAGFMVVRDHYLFTLPMVACAFILALRNPHYGAGSFFAFAGKKYSAYIYILHVFVMTLLHYGLKLAFGEEAYRNLTQNNLFRNSYPFLVFGVTLILVMAGYKVRSLLSGKFVSE